MSLESQQIETTTTTAAIPPPQKKVKLDEDNLPRDDDSSIHTANGTAKSLLNGNVDAPNGNEKQPDPVNNGPPLTSADAPPSNGNVDALLNGNDKQLGPVNNDPPANSPPPPKNNLKRPFSSVEADDGNENETVAPPENVVEPNEEGDERDEEEGDDDEDDDDVDEEDEDEEEVENDQQKEEIIVNTAAGDEGAEDESGWD